MSSIVLASGNLGKIREIQAILQNDKILPQSQFNVVEPEETGSTFVENAIIKARNAALHCRLPAIADDSGLVVDALGGRPGVYSARFAGENASDEDNNAKLLREMARLPEELRTATFRCVIALCFPDGTCRTFDGELRGVVLSVLRGTAGFGYDPLFLVPEYDQTLAELPLDVKNRISHRGNALLKLKEYLLLL